MEWPLGGLCVADLSAGIAGGYCTKVLADGARPERRGDRPAGERRHHRNQACQHDSSRGFT
jgi:hypothetical protein